MLPKIIHHRGRHGLIDGTTLAENTLAAFSRAVLEGAWMVELDVWGDLNVAHDPLTSSQGGPSLVEVIDLIKGRCAINIEVKSPSVAPDVLACIKTAIRGGDYSHEDFVLSSFHHQTAIDLKAAAPELKVGALNDGVLLPFYVERLSSGGIDILGLEWGNLYMDAESGFVLREVGRRLGMQIWAWTVNCREAYSTVLQYGVDAIFTDKPELFNKYRE